MPTTEWRDGRGRSRWQPTLEDRRVRLWSELHDLDVLRKRDWDWEKPWVYTQEPVTYRSKRRAERIARREQKRLDRIRLNRIMEVKP